MTEVFYVAVKGSLHAGDSSVFGIKTEEYSALCRRFPDSNKQVINGVLIKGSPLEVINSLAELGYRVTCSSGETEIVWTLRREALPGEKLVSPVTSPQATPPLQVVGRPFVVQPSMTRAPVKTVERIGTKPEDWQELNSDLIQEPDKITTRHISSLERIDPGQKIILKTNLSSEFNPLSKRPGPTSYDDCQSSSVSRRRSASLPPASSCQQHGPCKTRGKQTIRKTKSRSNSPQTRNPCSSVSSIRSQSHSSCPCQRRSTHYPPDVQMMYNRSSLSMASHSHQVPCKIPTACGCHHKEILANGNRKSMTVYLEDIVSSENLNVDKGSKAKFSTEIHTCLFMHKPNTLARHGHGITNSRICRNDSITYHEKLHGYGTSCVNYMEKRSSSYCESLGHFPPDFVFTETANNIASPHSSPVRMLGKSRSPSPMCKENKDRLLLLSHMENKDRSPSPVRMENKARSPSLVRMENQDQLLSFGKIENKGRSPSPVRMENKARSPSLVCMENQCRLLPPTPMENKDHCSPSPVRMENKVRSPSLVRMENQDQLLSFGKIENKGRSPSPVRMENKARSPSLVCMENQCRLLPPTPMENKDHCSPSPVRMENQDRLLSPTGIENKDRSLSPVPMANQDQLSLTLMENKDRSPSPIHMDNNVRSPSQANTNHMNNNCRSFSSKSMNSNSRSFSPRPPKPRDISLDSANLPCSCCLCLTSNGKCEQTVPLNVRVDCRLRPNRSFPHCITGRSDSVYTSGEPGTNRGNRHTEHLNVCRAVRRCCDYDSESSELLLKTEEDGKGNDRNVVNRVPTTRKTSSVDTLWARRTPAGELVRQDFLVNDMVISEITHPDDSSSEASEKFSLANSILKSEISSNHNSSGTCPHGFVLSEVSYVENTYQVLDGDSPRTKPHDDCSVITNASYDADDVACAGDTEPSSVQNNLHSTTLFNHISVDHVSNRGSESILDPENSSRNDLRSSFKRDSKLLQSVRQSPYSSPGSRTENKSYHSDFSVITDDAYGEDVTHADDTEPSLVKNTRPSTNSLKLLSVDHIQNRRSESFQNLPEVSLRNDRRSSFRRHSKILQSVRHSHHSSPVGNEPSLILKASHPSPCSRRQHKKPFSNDSSVSTNDTGEGDELPYAYNAVLSSAQNSRPSTSSLNRFSVNQIQNRGETVQNELESSRNYHPRSSFRRDSKLLQSASNSMTQDSVGNNLLVPGTSRLVPCSQTSDSLPRESAECKKVLCSNGQLDVTSCHSNWAILLLLKDGDEPGNVEALRDTDWSKVTTLVDEIFSGKTKRKPSSPVRDCQPHKTFLTNHN